MDSKEQSTLKVVMFPWLAYGHISPFLELAKQLSRKSFQIYFCSTHINLISIKDQISSDSAIQLVELPLPSLPDLPPHYHTTKNLPPHLMPTLKTALDMAQPIFSHLLKTLNPDLLIYDFIQPWAPTVSSSLNIPAVHFFCAGAATFSFLLHTSEKPDLEFPFQTIHLHDHEEIKISKLIQSYTNNIRGMDRLIQSMDRSWSFILIKTFREIEAKYLDYSSYLVGKEFIPMGPLVQEPSDHVDDHFYMEWLKGKDRSSVVFVSFGSEYFLSKEEMEEMARGLELSGVDFIWVVRFPEGVHMSLHEALPQWFLDGEKGLVVEGWAPQAKILQHSSVGGFVSHCGWSSVMEAMKFGVPIVAMPMHLDQPINARLVVELGVGVEVKRSRGGDWKFEGEEMAKGIREVVAGKKGEEVKRRVEEMREKINMGEKEMDAVAERLLQLCRNNRTKDFCSLN
ncbi:UDP-glucosyltransferase 29-like [Macadamia integrifolia]|uniref:UDP-glucosyltransferase 29-like n=1 Tax=Macadamia integrifolia TaxID=60698 RepID=UPI001C4FC132|nr:UDP-glucosyltransferase 29-like [Macadamia integrifolia]